MEPIKNLSDFEKAIEPYNMQADLFGKSIFLYRGQREDNSLLPKIGRYPFDNGVRKAIRSEKDIFNEFLRTAPSFTKQFSSQPNHILDWLSIAQHHGLATRLLDWTDNPYMALWFAIERISETKNKIDLNPTVYIVKVRVNKSSQHESFVLSPSEIADNTFWERRMTFARENDGYPLLSLDKTFFFQPRITSPRLLAQGGWFSIAKNRPQAENIPKNFMGVIYDDKLIPIEEESQFELNKIIISTELEAISNIKHQLNLLDINNRKLFPDIDGLCRHINWLDNNARFIKSRNLKRRGA